LRVGVACKDPYRLNTSASLLMAQSALRSSHDGVRSCKPKAGPDNLLGLARSSRSRKRRQSRVRGQNHLDSVHNVVALVRRQRIKTLDPLVRLAVLRKSGGLAPFPVGIRGAPASSKDMHVDTPMLLNDFWARRKSFFIEGPISCLPVIQTPVGEHRQGLNHRTTSRSDQQRPFLEFILRKTISLPNISGRIHNQMTTVSAMA